MERKVGKEIFGIITAFKGGRIYKDTMREAKEREKWKQQFSATCPGTDLQ